MNKAVKADIEKAVAKLAQNIQSEISEKYFRAVANHRMRELKKIIGK